MEQERNCLNENLSIHVCPTENWCIERQAQMKSYYRQLLLLTGEKVWKHSCDTK